MLPNNLPMAKASPTTEDIHRVPERLAKRHISNRRPRWPIARVGGMMAQPPMMRMNTKQKPMTRMHTKAIL